MRDITSNNFGLLIAYVLPGFTVLWELRLISPTVEAWLSATESNAPTVAGFLYATLGSVAIGLFLNILRWLLIDSLHHITGVRPTEWDFSHLAERVTAFQTIVDHNYKYHQFYGSMTIAVPIATAIHAATIGVSWWEGAMVIAGTAVFIAASRNALSRYYRRMASVLRNAGPVAKTT